MNDQKIVLELTENETLVLCKALLEHNPIKEDELISITLYAKLKRRLGEVFGNYETS